MALLLMSQLAVTTTSQHAWMSSCFSWPNGQLDCPQELNSQAIVPISGWEYQSVHAPGSLMVNESMLNKPKMKSQWRQLYGEELMQCASCMQLPTNTQIRA